MGLYEVVQSERKANKALLVKKGVHVKERHSVFGNSN